MTPLDHLRPHERQFIRWALDADLGSHLSIAEIGVADGRMSAAILQHVPDCHLLMVDDWRERPADDPYRLSGDAHGRQAQEQKDAQHTPAAHRARRFWPRAAILRADLATAVEFQATLAWFDAVFLDADHTEDGTTLALRVWGVNVRPGGIIAGDDIDHPDYPRWGVRAAVERHMANNAIPADRLVLGEGYTWMFRRP